MKVENEAGWIEWKGGECPVSEGTIGFIKFRDGSIEPKEGAPGDMDDLDWSHWGAGKSGSNGDIIAYRVVQA